MMIRTLAKALMFYNLILAATLIGCQHQSDETTSADIDRMRGRVGQEERTPELTESEKDQAVGSLLIMGILSSMKR